MSDFLAITLSKNHEDGSRESVSFNVPLRGVRLSLHEPSGGSVTFRPVQFPDRHSPFPVDTTHRSLLYGGRIGDHDGWGVTEMILCLPSVRMDIDVRRFGWMTHGHYLLHGFRYDLETMFQTRSVREEVARELTEAYASASVLRDRTALLMVAGAMRRWLEGYRKRQSAAAREVLTEMLPEPLVEDVLGAVLK